MTSTHTYNTHCCTQTIAAAATRSPRSPPSARDEKCPTNSSFSSRPTAYETTPAHCFCCHRVLRARTVCAGCLSEQIASPRAIDECRVVTRERPRARWIHVLQKIFRAFYEPAPTLENLKTRGLYRLSISKIISLTYFGAHEALHCECVASHFVFDFR